MSKHEDAVITKIAERAKLGLAKYGVTVERTDLSRLQWLQHAQDEAMDLAIYLQRLIDDAPQPPAMTREDAEKARMWDWCAKHSCFPYRDYEAWCGNDWAVDAPSGTVYGPNPEAAAAMAIDAAMKATEVTK